MLFLFVLQFHDFSDYPKDLKCLDPVNKKVIGKIKDGVKGKIITLGVLIFADIYFRETKKNYVSRGLVFGK